MAPASPAHTVSLVASDGTTSVTAQSVTVDAAGNWSISSFDVSTLADGTITFAATAADAAGNTATASMTANKDTVAPAVAIANASNPITLDNYHAAQASGTGEIGATISLVASDGSQASDTYTTTVDSDGNWSISGIDLGALADGTITFTVTATDAAGNSAPAAIDSTKQTVAITTTPAAINLSNAASTTISGTGQVGATIVLVATDGTNSTPNYTATVGSDGTWSIAEIDLTSLADGTITFTATASDAASNSATSSKTLTKDTVLPGIAFETVTNPINLFSVTEVAASGTGEVQRDDFAGCQRWLDEHRTADHDGRLRRHLVDRQHRHGQSRRRHDHIYGHGHRCRGQLGHIDRDGHEGHRGPERGDQPRDQPDQRSQRSQRTASGTGEVGASISLVASDGTTTTSAQHTTVDADGNWSISGLDTTALVDGTIAFTVTAADAAGNPAIATMTATKDVAAPAVAITAVTNPINLANAASTTANGTGEVGATISLVATDGAASTAPQTVVVDADGNWSVSGLDTTALADGTITFTATATDAAGNSAQATLTAMKDTVAPAVSLVTFANPINLENVASASAAGTGETGATISVTASDGTNTTAPVTAVVDADGNWSVAGIDLGSLADGQITYAAVASDAAGNTTTATQTTTKTTVAVTTVTDPINSANATAAAVSGTGQVGATISVVASDGVSSTTAATTTIDSNGNWSVAGIDVSSLADGTITFTATADDGSGKTAVSSKTAIKDTTAPTADSITLNDASPTSAASVTFTVTFSEDIVGLVSGDFAVVMGTGLTDASITDLSGSGSTYVVTVSTGSGTGTLGLNMVSAGAVQDTSGNSRGGSLPLVGSFYVITSNTSNAAQPLAGNAVDQVLASSDFWSD